MARPLSDKAVNEITEMRIYAYKEIKSMEYGVYKERALKYFEELKRATTLRFAKKSLCMIEIAILDYRFETKPKTGNTNENFL